MTSVFALPLAGPLAVVSVIAVSIAGLVIGFGLSDPNGSLARWTGHLARIAAEAAAPDRPAAVRMTAVTLDEALDDLSNLIADRFVHDVARSDRRAVFAAFGADHAVEIA